jgi:mono/diheme cytochrome c family protein
MQLGRTSVPFFVVLMAAILASCAHEDYPAWLWNAQHQPAPPPASTVDTAYACLQSRAQPLPARLVAMSANASSGGNVVLVSDLFQQFVQVCGSCHGPTLDNGQGGFQISRASDFQTMMTRDVLAHITMSVCPTAPDATNKYDPMPPCNNPNGGTYAQRPATDPVKQFAVLVGEWLDANSPVSFMPGGSMSGPMANPYVLSPADGNGMTNIGNCVPNQMATMQEDKAKQLDAMFAGLKANDTGTGVEMIGLPPDLKDTDLFTLDSSTLAKYAVYAYAPGYPLWSDNAGKLRHIRVPRGTSIRFDKVKQQFVIPPNTRFYKTFMKLIIDTDGSYRYRKIETRLIVARPDDNNPDGTAKVPGGQTALFGSYKWNDDETDAILVQTPLKNGKPFSDTQFYYNTDEQLAAEVLASQPADPEYQLQANHAIRHYAIPSSQRCIQCHMGSPSQDFILGFNPLQINRRPKGVSGTIEETGADELTQLQRFIDVGLITGISSPTDVLPLELSQGSRVPRNDYELTAQGYMVGNCQHCHNPRGFPTIQSPVLKDLLNLLPSAVGGIFQFPLERFSPRIGRGVTGTTQIPYITPSLVDQPKLDLLGNQVPDSMVRAPGGVFKSAIFAPWRSIIYRNVDAGFAYVDDYAIFPHMPFNTPGYDPRAKQIMGDWMTSIPAVRKHPEVIEYAYQTDPCVPSGHLLNCPVVDTESQPYVEVRPGDLRYDKAVAAAKARLQILHTGVNPAVPIDPTLGTYYTRYADLGRTDDIVDPDVLLDPVCHPVPAQNPGSPYPFPDHPHWVNTDLTDPPGYAPRQVNWPDVLVKQNIPPLSTTCMSPQGAADAYADQVDAVHLLPKASLNQVHDYATTPVPFGLWKQKPGCDLSSQQTVASFTGAARQHWMDYVSPETHQAPPPNAPVYSETPGAAVFKMICINCHGPRADSNGRLAQNLATMTGGNAAVADFRNGLFGPVGSTAPNRNMDMAFGTLPPPPAGQADWPDWSSTSNDDRAARYLAWMGLGGTPVNIPVALLQIVAVTQVLDQRRYAPGHLSANMLSQAKSLCLGLLGTGHVDDSQGGSLFVPGDGHGYLDTSRGTLNSRLIRENGDAELWLHLCSVANAHPIHVLTPTQDKNPGQLQLQTIEDVNYRLSIDGSAAQSALIPASVYPTNGAPVGDASGAVQPSYDPSNTWPWCVDERRASPAQLSWINDNHLPLCPKEVKTASDACGATLGPGCIGNDAANSWAVRGAINAGFSVFLYVQHMEPTGPLPDYNQCELLK